ncbi:hypothetical protein [Imhoffiella purpurea]|uniref:hypothetical protein n=1 Tax=Imhoffiella purpurea TaxID=1249627 RepID=UPI0012FE7DA7|nr:hypothetical protein [Imhoffiella purpurea]
MKDCWASEYSSCDGKISREHYISKSVFEQPFIYVSGFDWCKDKEKKIGLSNLTAKILCERHNNSLSFVDQAGLNAIRVFEQLLPAKYRSNSIPPKSNVVDGLNKTGNPPALPG